MESALVSSEYVAGLIDGEGWIGFAKHPQSSSRIGFNFTPVVSIQMRNNDQVLKFLADKYHGHFYSNTTRNSRYNHNWSPISIVQFTWRRVQPLLTDIAPFLHCKKKQAEMMLQYFKESYPIVFGKNHRYETDPFLQKKVWYYNELRRLNANGKAIQPLVVSIKAPKLIIREHIKSISKDRVEASIRQES